MKTRRKDNLKCTAVPAPCVQLLIRRKFTSFFWSLNIFTSKHLCLNHPPFWLLCVVTSWSGTGNENFWKWNGSFWWDWTDRSKRTTLTWKFPPGPNRSIYVWTEISGNFAIMESNRRVHVYFWSFHALADKTNNGPFPKPFSRVIRRSNGLICNRKYTFWLLIFAKSVLIPLTYLIAAAAPINTNGLLLYYKTQE